MSARKKIACLLIILFLLPWVAFSENATTGQTPLTPNDIAELLGWVPDCCSQCGGYYIEPAFNYPLEQEKKGSIAITSDESVFAQRGTSILTGNVKATRASQQITSNKAFLYRDEHGKFSSMELLGNVHLREPNTLIIGNQGYYYFSNKAKSLTHILYRTALHDKQILGAKAVPIAETKKDRALKNLTAWGSASRFAEMQPKIFDFQNASFSTCPPTHPAWKVKASHIQLDKNIGRGYATHARILVKNVPVFYIPYFSFSIDKTRKSGFLWPTFGTRNGPYFFAPFYWNMAPNYDMTITPGLITQRGVQVFDTFRYLTPRGPGNINFSILPGDRMFKKFQNTAVNNFNAGNYDTNFPTIEAGETELNRLTTASSTRKALFLLDDTRFNEHWSTHLDFKYVSDDYYLQDFGTNSSEITQNQLLQEGDINYKSEHINFIGRMQAYQTLHSIESPFVSNQYRRFPQLTLNFDYPDQFLGSDIFILNEATHFEFLNNPGNYSPMPIGNRLHTQPGISWAYYRPYFFFNPRIQAALTEYELFQLSDMTNPPPSIIRRALPIFDLATGLAFDRDFTVYSHPYTQTLEPQLYYTYIPYKDQSNIPNFDTIVNILTYDQIFNYNRFTGIDRIGDANQLGIGVTSRLRDAYSGFEKARFGIGEILYFRDRKVTLCNSASVCTDYYRDSSGQLNPSNTTRVSPISALLNYNVSPYWSIVANTIWNPITKQVGNANLTFHYQTDNNHIFNFVAGYARNGDINSGIIINDSTNNMKYTDVSMVWPITHDVVAFGRWAQDWRLDYFQTLIYGLQYDTCCWAVRLAGSRTYTNLAAQTGTPQYDTAYYIQFNLKGLGNIGSGNPNSALGTINGYNTAFGQET